MRFRWRQRLETGNRLEETSCHRQDHEARAPRPRLRSAEEGDRDTRNTAKERRVSVSENVGEAAAVGDAMMVMVKNDYNIRTQTYQVRFEACMIFFSSPHNPWRGYYGSQFMEEENEAQTL